MLKALHRINAVVIAAFLAMHLANHLAILGGVDDHLRVQALLRQVYRAPAVEVAIFAAFGMQVALGLALLIRRGWPKGTWSWIQAASGAYLALFLAQHLTAIVMARIGGLDTTTWFAAAVVSRSPFVWYFAPYSVLGVAAVFAHIAAAIRFRALPGPPPPAAIALPALGGVLGVMIVAGLMGAFGPVPIPAPYQAYLETIIP